MDIEKSIERAGAEVYKDISGARLTSFMSGGAVRFFIMPADETSLIKTVCALSDGNVPYLVIGNGTNTLITDSGYNGALISLKKLSSAEVVGETVRAGAGASLKRLVQLSADNGLTGLEFAEGIPASAGGAVAMNAGAFGAQISDTVESVNVLKGYNVVSMQNEDVGFRYRGSGLKDKKLIITSAVFKLKRCDAEDIEKRISGFAEKRAFSQPKGISAGSVFKNADGISAGYCLDKLGFKGKRVGGAQVSEKHANIILNAGGANTADFLTLADEMEKAVYYEYGIHLEKEVEIIGD